MKNPLKDVRDGLPTRSLLNNSQESGEEERGIHKSERGGGERVKDNTEQEKEKVHSFDSFKVHHMVIPISFYAHHANLYAMSLCEDKHTKQSGCRCML